MNRFQSLSNFGFNCSVRPCNKANKRSRGDEDGGDGGGGGFPFMDGGYNSDDDDDDAGDFDHDEVGCRAG